MADYTIQSAAAGETSTCHYYRNECIQIPKNSKFINQFTLDEFIYIEELDGTTVRGLHDAIGLADIGKGHKNNSYGRGEARRPPPIQQQ